MSTLVSERPLDDLLEAFPNGWTNDVGQTVLQAVEPTSPKQSNLSNNVFSTSHAKSDEPIEDLIAALLQPTFPDMSDTSTKKSNKSVESAKWEWGDSRGHTLGSNKDPPARTFPTVADDNGTSDSRNIAWPAVSLTPGVPSSGNYANTSSRSSPNTSTSSRITPSSSTESVPAKQATHNSQSSPTYGFSLNPSRTRVLSKVSSMTHPVEEAPSRSSSADLNRTRKISGTAKSSSSSNSPPGVHSSIRIAGRAKADREAAALKSSNGNSSAYEDGRFKQAAATEDDQDGWREPTDELPVQAAGWRQPNLPRILPAQVSPDRSSFGPEADISHTSSSDTARTSTSTRSSALGNSSFYPKKPTVEPIPGLETGWQRVPAPHLDLKSGKRQQAVHQTGRRYIESEDPPPEPSHWVGDEPAKHSYTSSLGGRSRGKGRGTDSYRPKYASKPRADYPPRRADDNTAPRSFKAKIMAFQPFSPSTPEGDDEDYTFTGLERDPGQLWIKPRSDTDDLKRNIYTDSWEMQRKGVAGRFNKRNKEGDEW